MSRFPTDPDRARFPVLATVWPVGTFERHIPLEPPAPARRTRKARPPAKDPDPTTLSVTVEAAAALLDCGETTAWRLLREGKLVRARTDGQKTRVTRASVEARLRASAPPEKPRRRRPATSDPPTVETDPVRLRAALRASHSRLFGKS